MYVVVCSLFLALADITAMAKRKKKIEEYIPTYKKGEICVVYRLGGGEVNTHFMLTAVKLSSMIIFNLESSI